MDELRRKQIENRILGIITMIALGAGLFITLLWMIEETAI